MKFDGLTGLALWPAPFHYRSAPGADTLFSALAADLHGDLLVTGGTGPQRSEPFVLKLDGATGQILWGPMPCTGPLSPVSGRFRVAVDGAGNALVSGSTGSAPSGEFVATKFDGRTGALLWGPVLVPAEDAGLDFVSYAAPDTGGNLIIAGERFASSGRHFILVKIAGASGTTLWGPTLFDGIGGFSTLEQRIRLDARGDVLLAGTVPGPQGFESATLLKVSGRDGSVLWGPIPYPGNTNAYANPIAIALEIDTSGALFATFSEGDSPQQGHSALTVKVDGGTGRVLWGPAVLPASQFGGGLSLDAAGNLLLAVSTTSSDAAFFMGKSKVILYSGATGETIRGPTELPTAARLAWVQRVAADANGDVVSLGRLSRSGAISGADQTVLVKYGGATGSILWGPIEMPANVWGWPVDLKLAPNGDPIWVGSGDNGLVLSRFSTVTGAVIWGPIFSAGNAGATAIALALDRNGDAFVLGDVRGSSSDRFVTTKYDGKTGGLLWGPMPYDVVVPGGLGALAVGPAGDVTVVGSAPAGGIAIQYRGATGAIAWSQVFPGFGIANLAADAEGDLVTLSRVSGDQSAVQLHKLRGVDGTIVWESAPFQDPAGGFIGATTLALDTVGNAVAGAVSYQPDPPARASLVAKFDGGSGAPLWGPVAWGAKEAPVPVDPFFLAIDSSNDVVLAANGLDDAYPDMAVRKYSGADGSPAWGPVTLDGSGPNQLLAFALAGNDPVLAGTGSWSSMRTVRFGFGLSLETQTWQVPPALCGQPYRFGFQTRNGAPPLSFTIASGALPTGIVLNLATGQLSGVPLGNGTFSFRLRVASAAGSVERDYTLAVGDGQPQVDIGTTASTLCLGDTATLSVPGVYSSYMWLPGGETTPTVTVSPTASTTYGFIGTMAGGCVQHGSRVLTVLPALGSLSISAPLAVSALASDLLAAVADHSGSRYAWSIVGGQILSGQGTHQIRFAAGVGGNLMLAVVETNAGGCSAPAATFVAQVTPASTSFFTLAPCRAYDSRIANAPPGAGEIRRLTLAGTCGLPLTARAVAMNVTAVGPTADGFLSIAPQGSGGGAGAGVSFRSGQTRASNSIMGLGAGGGIDVSCQMPAGKVHLVIDVAGYFE